MRQFAFPAKAADGQGVTRSINGKLGRLVVVAVGAAMVLVTALTLWLAANQYRDSKTETLRAAASAFAASVGPAVAKGDENRAMLALRGISRLPTFTYAAVVDASGRAVAEAGSAVRLSGDMVISEDAPLSILSLLTTHTAAVSVPILDSGEKVGRLILVGEAKDLRSRLLLVIAVAAIGAVVAIGIGLLISVNLQRSITRPLIALSGAMTRVQASHDYGASVDIRSDDEIGLLARSFNTMLRQIRDRDQRLAEHRDHLEQEVEERKSEVKGANVVGEAANLGNDVCLVTICKDIYTPMKVMMVMAETMD